jgi:hypothetical protein
VALEDDLVRDYREPGLLDLWDNARRAVEPDRLSFGDLAALTEVGGLLGVHSPTAPSKRRLVHFFASYWPRQELNGLFTLRGGQGTRLVPVPQGRCARSCGP